MNRFVRLGFISLIFIFSSTKIHAYELNSYPCTSSSPPSTLVKRTVPTRMSPGQTATVEFQIANCSGVEWTQNIYKLGAANPIDNQTFSVGRVEFPASVPTGYSITFNFPITAPQQMGSYTLQFGVLNLTKWFPPYLPPDLILVGNLTPCPNEITLKTLMNTSQDAQPALQNCLDSVPEGSLVEIPVGEYLLYNTLKIKKRITLFSQGTADIRAICTVVEGLKCATFKAHPDFPLNNLTNAGDSSVIAIVGSAGEAVSNPALKNIIVDGNHKVRTKPTGTYPLFNIFTSSTHGMFFYNALINAGSGTSLSGWGENNAIAFNYVGMNGSVSNVNGNPKWSDGISLVGKYFVVMNNYFANNTDVDLILWGAAWSNVHFNTIVHDLKWHESFAALMINTWDQDESQSDFTGGEFSYNTISCNKMCGFGIQIGEKTWRKTAVSIFGGSVTHNIIDGAIQGLNTDGAGRSGKPVTIGFNTYLNSGGVSTPYGFTTNRLNQNPSDYISYVGGEGAESFTAWGDKGYTAPSCYFFTNYCLNSVQCTDFTYSNWGTCTNGFQYRTMLTRGPASCVGGLPITAKICTSKIGDANSDGKVNGQDYVTWLNNYNSTTTAGSSNGDFNGDTKVNGQDYVVWFNNYGT